MVHQVHTVDDRILARPGAEGLGLVRAGELTPSDPSASWLVQHLWAAQGCGVIGGQPKTMKSLLALEISVSVASGTPCLGSYEVDAPGTVIIISMEGTHGLLRHRLDRIAAPRGIDVGALPIKVATTSSLFIDDPWGYRQLEDAVRAERPRLLVIDPFVRVFRGDEDDAGSVSKVLGLLRKLQLEYGTAVMLVHHSRKGTPVANGQSLRGSGDFHAWGDSNLYVVKDRDGVSRVRVEHRATEAPEDFSFSLFDGRPMRVESVDPHEPEGANGLRDAILRALGSGPLGLTDIQRCVGRRRESVSTALHDLERVGRVREDHRKWHLVEGAADQAEDP